LDAPGALHLDALPLRTTALGPSILKYRYNRKLIPWLRENVSRYDAVVVNGIWQYHARAVAHVLRGSGIPYFVFTHGMLDPWFKTRYPLKHLKKCIYWQLSEYRALRGAAAVLFTCEEERLLARQSFAPYDVREEVVGYGIASPDGDAETQRRAFLNQFPSLKGARFLLFLSRIHEKKGCDLLLRAFADEYRGDHTMLVMAGPAHPSIKNRLLRLAESLGIGSRIIWTGLLTGDAKWGAFRSADAFVLPSHQENFGIVVAEALATGLPVLISNKVNIWREIAAQNAGLVDNDDVEGARRLLRSWRALTAGEVSEMRRRALTCYAQNFTVEPVVQRLLAIIRRSLALPERFRAEQ
jgi:glycosyltransferase involved in cell wall biosynthesis